jgi:hypothetical protein
MVEKMASVICREIEAPSAEIRPKMALPTRPRMPVPTAVRSA